MLVVDLSLAVHHLNAFTCMKCGMDMAKVCSDNYVCYLQLGINLLEACYSATASRFFLSTSFVVVVN